MSLGTSQRLFGDEWNKGGTHQPAFTIGPFLNSHHTIDVVHSGVGIGYIRVCRKLGLEADG